MLCCSRWVCHGSYYSKMIKSNKKKIKNIFSIHKKKRASYLLRLFNATAWLILIAMIIVMARAQPEFESFFDRFYGFHLRTEWDNQFTLYLLYISISGLICSIMGCSLTYCIHRNQKEIHYGSYISFTAMMIMFTAVIAGALVLLKLS